MAQAHPKQPASRGTEAKTRPPLAGVVDVIMAAWNREATIERAIRTALADPAICRVVVVDDASTDHTAECARSCDQDSGRVIVERFERNQGPAAARNAALALSSSPWIAVVDADDYLLPGRFSKLLRWARDWDFIADDMLQIRADRIGQDEPEALLSSSPFEPWACDLSTFVLGNVSRPGELRKELGFFKPLTRRSFLDEHGLRYDEALRLGEDYALTAKSLALGARLLVVPVQGYVSVTRSDSLSAHHSKHDLEQLRDSDRALAKLTRLSTRERDAVEKHYRSVDARVQWLEAIESVKARQPARFLALFFRSWDVTRFVAARLWEQVVERSMARLSRR